MYHVNINNTTDTNTTTTNNNDQSQDSNKSDVEMDIGSSMAEGVDDNGEKLEQMLQPIIRRKCFF